MDRYRVALILPALNEAQSIAAVVNAAVPYGLPIVVDDGSSDATASLAAGAGAVVVRHAVNQGYDAALNSGFAEAGRRGCDIAVTLDADGQHNPALIAEFLAALEAGADVVAGVRHKLQRISEKIFALYTNSRFGIRDPMCGMKAYRMEVYFDRGHFDSYRSIGSELLLFAAARGYRVTQLPLRTGDRLGVPRFGGILKANYRILRAMLLGIKKVDAMPRAATKNREP